MNNAFILLITVVFFSFSPHLAFANDSIEITPTIGYRFGGDFDQEDPEQEIDLKEKVSYGLTLAWDYDKKRQGLLILSHYNTEFEFDDRSELPKNEIGVTYLHLGGNVPISSGALPFWLSGGLGVTHFSPDENDLDNETDFSANIGINTRLNLINNIDLTMGARMYATFLDSESEIFCNNDTCKIYVSSDVWIQNELYMGLTFQF